MSTEKSTQVTVNIDSSAEEREKLEAIQKVIDTYKDKEGCLIAVLHLAQEIYGYLPLEVQRLIADGMGVTLSYVSSVVTFYSYFSMIPRAEHAIKICLARPAMYAAASALWTAWKKCWASTSARPPTTASSPFRLRAAWARAAWRRSS